MSFSTLPVEVLMRGRRALVLGASGECVSKIHRLVDAGADVLVVTHGTSVDPDVAALADAGRVRLEARAFVASDARESAVVFVATELESIGAALSEEARANGRLVSTLDRPEASTFINPAVAKGGGLSFSISSGGAAPGLVKILRREIEHALGRPRVGAFVRELARLRDATPRGERGPAARKLLDGLAIDMRWTFPRWFRERRPPILRTED